MQLMKGLFYMAINKYKTKSGLRYRYKFNYDKKEYQEGGFLSAKLAKHAEATKLNKLKHQGSSDIYFNNLVDEYMNDIKNHVKESTFETKKNIITKHIIPLFIDKPISDIKPLDIRKWQGEVKNKGYTETFQRSIQSQLSAIFNYAVKFYDLHKNPVPIAGSLGKKNRETFEFWTIDEFRKYMSVVDDEQSFLITYLLFFTGIRIGEAIALTWKDIDFENNVLHVNKTKQRVNGRWILTEPKTKKSKRQITITSTLISMLMQWKKMKYKPKNNDFIFITDKTVLAKHITKYSTAANVKKIRVHDIRHSHASLLIELGVNIIEVSERLGHEKVQTTIDTYIHLYPNKQIEIAKKLELL